MRSSLWVWSEWHPGEEIGKNRGSWHLKRRVQTIQAGGHTVLLPRCLFLTLFSLILSIFSLPFLSALLPSSSSLLFTPPLLSSLPPLTHLATLTEV